MNNIKKLLKKWILWYSYVFYKKNHGSKILFYHDVFDKKQYTEMGTSLRLFQQHIEVIERCGFKIVGKIQHTEREIMICFDDGFRGIYDTKDFFIQQQIKPIIFIAVDLIGKDNYLSKEEIIELQSLGFRFESHTWHHKNLAQFNEDELKHELLDSKQYLSDLLGKNIESICFPMGYFSDKVIAESIKYGYKYLYSSLPGNFHDNIYKKLYTRNLVQFCTKKELKYRLLCNSSILRKRAIKLHYKKQKL
jgi:peptidoglycan/xylan/chitin deacetylase (PgdA/CDA1 family)